MGSVVQFPSGKAAFKRNKLKRLERQRAILDEIYAQPYTQWVPLLMKHWPYGLPNLAFDERLTDTLFEEYTLTSLRQMLVTQAGVELSDDEINPRTTVYNQLVEQMREEYHEPLELLARSIQDIHGPKTVFARVLNPLVYEQAPPLDDPADEWEWMMASSDWDPIQPWNGNLELLSLLACGLHLEGTVFVHQQTGMAFERDGQWIKQEKVYGFVLHTGSVTPLSAAKAKEVYAMDPDTCAPRSVPNHLSFGEAVVPSSVGASY